MLLQNLLKFRFSTSAEAGGFEPPVRLPVRQFSKLLVSATHPNFQSSAYGNRTRVSAVRGPRPRPLDESALFHKSNAEAGGFEPPVRLPVRQFSKLLVSATHPNFQYFLCGSVFSQTRCKDKRSFRPVQAFEAFFFIPFSHSRIYLSDNLHPICLFKFSFLFPVFYQKE